MGNVNTSLQSEDMDVVLVPDSDSAVGLGQEICAMDASNRGIIYYGLNIIKPFLLGFISLVVYYSILVMWPFLNVRKFFP